MQNTLCANAFISDSFTSSNTVIVVHGKISENTEKKSLHSIIGGGDTISAINKNNKDFYFTHLSTAGGAFLEFLEGKDLPGLNVLK